MRKCRGVVDELHREVFDQFGRTRIWKCLVLSDVVAARTHARSLDIKHPEATLADEFTAELKSAGLSDIGRTESQLLAITVAQALRTVSDDDGSEDTEAATLFISMLERMLGHQLSHSDLRSLIHVWTIGRGGALRNRIGLLLKQPCERLDNRMQLFLIPPDAVD